VGSKDVEILHAHPQLKLEDIHAALAYAAEVVRQGLLLPITIQAESQMQIKVVE
jgi:hypothetical protein